MKPNELKAQDLVRAWKDTDYRESLKNPPVSPAGVVELDDSLLTGIHGGNTDWPDTLGVGGTLANGSCENDSCAVPATNDVQ